MLTTKLRWTASLALLGMAGFIAGCGGGDDPAPETAGGGDSTAVANADAGDEEAGHNLEGWWCAEHGVPEGECTRCNSTLIAGFKDKGDWCDEHDLPESQCTKCDPKRADKFIARFEAKFGKKPPAPSE